MTQQQNRIHVASRHPSSVNLQRSSTRAKCFVRSSDDGILSRLFTLSLTSMFNVTGAIRPSWLLQTFDLLVRTFATQPHLITARWISIQVATSGRAGVNDPPRTGMFIHGFASPPLSMTSRDGPTGFHSVLMHLYSVSAAARGRRVSHRIFVFVFPPKGFAFVVEGEKKKKGLLLTESVHH